MKKLLILALLVVLLTGCKKEDPPIDVLSCLDNQIEVQGECITLTGPELQLHQTLEAMKTRTNYTIETVITDGLIDHSVTMKFMDTTSYYQDANEEIYYVKDGDVCRKTTEKLSIVSTETIPCTTGTTQFFTQFEYSWFALESGVYELLPFFFSKLEPFFSSMIEGATLEAITMQISDTKIDSILVELLDDRDTYILEFTFSSYGSVVITLPQE